MSVKGQWRSLNQVNDIKTIPIQKVRVKYNRAYDENPLNKLGSLTAVEDYVWFSEKPGGEKVGYYGIQTDRNFIVNGSKKDKIKYTDMKSLYDDWYEYDFGRILYVRKIGMFVDQNRVQIYYKDRFVLDVDTTTAEGKYEAAAKLYSQKNLAGWSNDDYEELRSLGFNLLKNSAAADYAPALYTMGRLIFSNDPDPVNDRMYLKSFEKLAEKSGSQAIEAMLYLQKNYMIGANNIDNTYMLVLLI